jgi:hypothetical protein
MRGRSYSVQFANVAVSAVQDLLAVICGASKSIELHGVVIGQITGTSVQNLNLSVKVLPATVTNGSGGAAVTPQKMERGDAAATVTARRNDTTQATTSGTAVTVHSDVFNVINGYQFFWPAEDRPTADLSEAIILSLNTAPSSALTMSGTLYFAERN